MLARSLARKYSGKPPMLDADDLEQHALTELCRQLDGWDEEHPFEWYAWHTMNSAILSALQANRWRKWGTEIPGRTLHPADALPEAPAPLPDDRDEIDGCVICGEPMPGRRGNAVYCSPACRHQLHQLRLHHKVILPRGSNRAQQDAERPPQAHPQPDQP